MSTTGTWIVRIVRWLTLLVGWLRAWNILLLVLVLVLTLGILGAIKIVVVSEVASSLASTIPSRILVRQLMSKTGTWIVRIVRWLTLLVEGLRAWNILLLILILVLTLGILGEIKIVVVSKVASSLASTIRSRTLVPLHLGSQIVGRLLAGGAAWIGKPKVGSTMLHIVIGVAMILKP